MKPVPHRNSFESDGLAPHSHGMSFINRRTFVGLALLSPWAVSAAVEGGPEDLKELLSSFRETSGLPAIAAAVMKSGKVLAAGAVGVCKAGTTTPVTLANKFHLGSDTKAMTATVAAMFVEEGKLKWDQTLADLFPERAEK